jgi:UDP-N-acetylglucosamine diphosphorylase/glucosamine-1-phosphate N-acetyltransferase
MSISDAPQDANDIPGCLIIPANILPTRHNFSEILKQIEKEGEIKPGNLFQFIEHPSNIFQFNDTALRSDFELLTHNRQSQPIDTSNIIRHSNQIFLEEGAKVWGCTLNAETGPIYIGKNATIMEGSCIRGPFSIGENSIVKMGSTLYGATTVGPNCVVGGEIKNSVFFECSNKAHHGYLGDSVIGAWCNLGAGTTNSNVKNTAGNIEYISTDAQHAFNAGSKAGLLMGDYSRTAIQTAINTGTMVGVCCNIFGTGFPPRTMPSFCWGNERYEFDKALQHIQNWKQMKGQSLTESEINLLTYIHQQENL